jgi:hypothetical protein
MAEVRLVKFRFKPGGKEAWLEWCGQMKRRSNEIFETLRNEGMVAEACFLSHDEDALYYFLEAEDFEQSESAFRRSLYAIDREHMQIKTAALERAEGLECLFFFDNR